MWKLFVVSLWLCDSLFAVAQSTCGMKGYDDTPWGRMNGTSPKIVNGQDATPCEYTWQISMRQRSNHYCGGSIISDKWILTAAHCVPGASGDTIVVGDYNKDSNNDQYQAEHSIKQIISHPKYNSRTMKYDFALIELRTAIKFNECVGAVCLPEADATTGAGCFISGWGTLSSGGSSPNKLQEAEVAVMTNEMCCGDYGYSCNELHQSMLCANGRNSAGQNIDACQGDSGGPLACEERGKWVLHGVTSWGYGCAQATYPGVYGRVWDVIDWVNENIGSSGGGGGGSGKCEPIKDNTSKQWCKRRCNKNKCHQRCSKKCSDACKCNSRRLEEVSGSSATVSSVFV